jgi:hypothetical protein
MHQQRRAGDGSTLGGDVSHGRDHIETFRDRWKGKLYRSALRPTFFIEMLLATYMVASFSTIAYLGEWAALPYLGLFVAGYVYVFGLSLIHARR